MTSRRPMIRTYSGNGRTSSFSEEEGGSSNGRSESRSTYLSNVRPENSYSRYSHYRPTRSTLCSVMAQLTEDVQPSFDTTLKSKAVSENCNAKFTCVVSGYPAPELKWYKDDMEMDRYCGLPKYEIRRNGKTHTLHIYNCTLDDAAIYQVSASNSKGIVSCSGVLEVGTMNEYQIHQRFFAKLKQKAEKKKLEVHAKKEDKENVQKEKPKSSPERPPRKRHIPPPDVTPAVKGPEAMEQQGATAEPNAASSEVKEVATKVITKGSELNTEASMPEKTLATKKIKISNGVDDGVNNSSSSGKSHMMGNGGENCYDGGISLAQFLAEALQSQATEEKQNPPQGENSIEVDTPTPSTDKEKDNEQERVSTDRKEQEKPQEEEKERQKRREEEMALEKGREKEKQSVKPHTMPNIKYGSEVRRHSKAHKDHDHHNIQASISSMLHTVKDFLFGKNKKDSHDHFESREREFDHSADTAQPSQADMPPSFQLQQDHHHVPDALMEDVVPMEMDKPKELPEILSANTSSVSLGTQECKHEDSAFGAELPPSHKLPTESLAESIGQSVKEAEDAVEPMEVSTGPGSSCPVKEMPLSGPQVLTEVDSETASVVCELPKQQQVQNCVVVSPQPNNGATRDEPSPVEDIFVTPETQATSEDNSSPKPSFTSAGESWTPPDSSLSMSESHSLVESPTESLQEEDMDGNDMGKKGEPETEKDNSNYQFCGEEKAEVKSSKEALLEINRHEISKIRTFSVEERTESCESNTFSPVPLPVSTANSGDGDIVKEDTPHGSMNQEVNVEFPVTAAQDRLERGDLKIKQGGSSKTEKSPEVPTFVEMKKPASCEEVFIPAVEKDLEEKKDAAKEEEIVESKDLSVRANKEGSALVLEENSSAAKQDIIEEHQCSVLTENIPIIEISTVEDIPDIKPTVLDAYPEDHFIIPKIEIMAPELKECTLPLTILALNKQTSESAVSQKHDATHVSAALSQDQRMADSPSLLPTQKGIQDNNVSPVQKVKIAEGTDEKIEMPEPEQQRVKSNEKLPQMDFGTIPVISVSCSDDKGDDVHVDSQLSDTPRAPLCLVEPISVTSHDNDSAPIVSALSQLVETETSAATQSGTENDAGSDTPINPEKALNRKQNQEEVADKSVRENKSTALHETLVPKVGDNVPSFNKLTEVPIVPDILQKNNIKEAKVENSVSVEDLLRNSPSVERLFSKPPTHPSLSPASLRKFMSRTAPESDSEALTSVITPGGRQSEKADDDLSGGSTPTSSLSCESSPRLKRRDSLTLIRSATPEELASGARRKIFIPKPKEEGEGGVVGALDAQGKKESPYMSPSQARRVALLQAGQNTPPMERRSPLLSRRKVTLEVPKFMEETSTEELVGTKREEKPAEKKLDPLKAPQVIRKIRGEPFPDASGHLKLWCQFFNVLSDSTIKWCRDEEEILQVKRRVYYKPINVLMAVVSANCCPQRDLLSYSDTFGGDESQVALAIVLATSQDCGVYSCSISNEYGTDTTDFLLSVDILSEILLKDDLEVGEEIEMTPLQFTKGLADSGSWGDKYFGRIMTEAVHIGEGCAHKTTRVRVIYGLDPIFESGTACIMKVQNPIAYGTKQESNLAERNGEITKQECKVQNMIREYCKIFTAEARLIENFGQTIEVVPQYLMYRPANAVPYATVEADLKGVYLKYCTMDPKGTLITGTVSELEQKCCSFQHWIHQWTHGNLLVTQLEGVETKITNVRVVTKSQGYQGLTERGSPEVFEQFLTHHQCNYFCGLLGLKPLKTTESLQPSTRVKGSRSPLLNRKLGSSSPQMQRKGQSPQMPRKANTSPRVTRKAQETEDNKSGSKSKPVETSDVLEIR